MPRTTDRPDDAATAVRLGHVLARSSHFKVLFSEGMLLVEEAAAYLDGPGRVEARLLSPTIATAYSAESMRLTTRLMQLASWLLIRRAVVEGEMSQSDAQTQRVKVTIAAQSRVTAPSVFDQLPSVLRDLTERSLRMQSRVLHLDRMLHQDQESESTPANGALQHQHALLSSAYPAAR